MHKFEIGSKVKTVAKGYERVEAQKELEQKKIKMSAHTLKQGFQGRSLIYCLPTLANVESDNIESLCVLLKLINP